MGLAFEPGRIYLERPASAAESGRSERATVLVVSARRAPDPVVPPRWPPRGEEWWELLLVCVQWGSFGVLSAWTLDRNDFEEVG